MWTAEVAAVVAGADAGDVPSSIVVEDIELVVVVVKEFSGGALDPKGHNRSKQTQTGINIQFI